tara:strand:+ start:1467 stop:1706 length:240 start_codon:yes stop_codon:yes gene_type:complete
MNSRDILNTLDLCDKLNLDFFLVFDKYKERFTPTLTYKINPNINLPQVLHIYDAGWDEVDTIIFKNITNIIPIVGHYKL